MNVLHIETRRHLSGGAKQVLTLMRGLKQHGVESTLLCADDSVVAEFAQAEKLPVRLVDYRGSHDFSLLRKIRETAIETRCDLIHAHSGRGTADYSALFARRFDAPVLLTQRTIRNNRRLLSGFKYRSFTKIASISEAVDRSLRDQDVPESQRSVIYDGVDFSDFSRPHPRSTLLEEFDLPVDAVILGNVGRFNENKGQLNLLQTFLQLYEKYPKLHLVLFGNGEMLDELLDFIEENDLSGRVHIAGFKSDLPKWYASLDLLVHTAKQEALSIVILEANANSVPAIAYNTGGISEIIEHARSGLLVQPGQIDQLADAIERLLNDPVLHNSMGQKAQAICQKTFTSERMCAKYFSLYEEMVKNYS